MLDDKSGNGHRSRLPANGTEVVLGEDILDEYDLKILDDEPESPPKNTPPHGEGDSAEADAAFDDASVIEIEEGDRQATHDVKRRDGEKSGFFKRVLVAGVALLLVGGIVLGAVYLFLFRGSRDGGLTFRRRAAQTTSQKEAPSKGITAEEINRERGQANPTAANPDDKSAADGANPITSRPPFDSYAATVNPASPNVTERNNGGAAETSGARVTNSASLAAGASPTNPTGETRGGYGPSTERSIRANPPRPAGGEQEDRGTNSNRGRERSDDANRRAALPPTGVPLPPLGTMLPVRTLGTIYTLRSGSLVRMQLTRGVSGKGWNLRRGTEFYGVMRGSDYEVGRAYIALIGFVDPDSNRLVRLSGNLLGGDGTDGLRGQKRQLHSRWTRAAREAFAGAVDVLGAIASSVGRRPVVIGDVYGQRTISPLTQEFNRSAAGNHNDGFVEVPANTPGYVLVLTMPGSMQGVDARPDSFSTNLSENIGVSDLQQLAAEQNDNSASQLSDAELSELLTTGGPAQIRAALPRMSPTMRQVAEQVLAQGN